MPKATPDDFYALLGVSTRATAQQLRSAWRRLAMKWHPDRAGAGATALFQELLAAYTVLADPVARGNYDRRRRGGAARSPRAAPGIMLERVCGPLKSLLACGIARHAESGVIELILTSEEALHGGMITISMRVPVRCPACLDNRSRPCARCGMKRQIDDLYSAWLAVPPGTEHGDMLIPSAMLPGMIQPVSFRICSAAAT